MLIQSKDLLHLSVETQDGYFLGRVSGFEMDVDTHAIINYYVKTMTPANILQGSLYEQFIISFRQVISISKEKMIVEDGTRREKVVEKIEPKAVAAGAV